MIWRILVAVLAASLIVLWTMWTLAVNAHAGGVRKICNTFTGECWLEGKPKARRHVHRKRHKHRHRRKRRAEVRGYVRRDREDEDRDRVKCYDAVRVVGSQWASEAGAEESAQKAWMERVRWSIGEAAMSMTAAEGYEKRCSRSSVGELANQVLHRCEVRARPCRPVFQSK